MATSGTTNFTQTRNEIILDALQLLGIYGIGRTVSAEDMTFAVAQFNKMIKAWGTKGLHLWLKEDAMLFLTPGQVKYTLGAGLSTVHCALYDDVVETQLTTGVSQADTTIAVLDTTGMTIGDKVGVVLPDLSTYWTTINTIPSSTSLTLTSGMSAAASSGALVYTYTTDINKPLRILNMQRVQGFDIDRTEVPLTAISYDEYMALPNKVNAGGGIPNQYMYNPRRTDGDMYFWLSPNDSNLRIRFAYERIVEDLAVTSDNLDFPNEWLEPATWQLAVRLAPAFGKDQKMMQAIFPLASDMLKNLMDWDSEITSVSMQMDYTGDPNI